MSDSTEDKLKTTDAAKIDLVVSRLTAMPGQRMLLPMGLRTYRVALKNGGRTQANEEGKGDTALTQQGTIQGVMLPCMANILGVLLFLRLPWIVGLAGVWQSFGAVLLGCTCTFITSLSLSAVATNGKVKAGGSYYLISRSLGPAIGSAVGLNFFLANGIGAAMYIIGTVEAFETGAPGAQPADVGSVANVRVVGLIVLAASALVVGAGLKYVSKAATLFLAIVLLVILCMALGCFIGPTGLTSEIEFAYLNDPANAAAVTPDLLSTVLNHTWVVEEGFTGVSSRHFGQNADPQYDAIQTAFPLDSGTSWNFFAMVALWFPACTGIMAGSNRSSELKDPKRSIPTGTLFAQLSTSAWPVREVVVYGVLASSLGAALQSLTSATRLLTAIATDGMLAPFLNCFRNRDGKEPYPSLALATVICTCAILIGEINAIAPILTMCFLMCYLCVNINTMCGIDGGDLLAGRYNRVRLCRMCVHVSHSQCSELKRRRYHPGTAIPHRPKYPSMDE
ncbi:hypothetical protein FOL46_001812 [Perkinsus olseni]|uniref:Amino acid permease/ SLC12A domain-containing protein n=1 Tax=Perkinsus olseni TaxID=32597 RepID=A0A7J6MB87_PEROL|nr:hypothetical protein FOL46_001812 [Perkinsus olseni]